MKLSYKLVISAFFVTVISSFIWSANHYYSKYQYEKKRADEAVQNAKLATAITNNILQSLQIVNTVLEANQHAKQQIALESQRTQEDIKMAVADDDCASRPVPAAAADRLRKYADSLRNSTSNSASSYSDFGNASTAHTRYSDLW
ncbi:DUF2570 domain-containing protein [Escherichia coli]|uniref:DUF2570 domain-containing protein n=1 Tax=Escherichia TaxID=561 RepID=UPI000CF792AD|nr:MULTISPECIES: DUF2570 domain-containing protein [Escherichia]EFC5428840.1 DUF2570 domain-containing protein [Escherichia coli]EFO2386061.1 DUF2570 domain-containing protein [Escherichia coli]EIH3781961.1 DUF2570 domain-containing protein [Escherichia coli]EJW6186912.1 DUF2570 domain-containing protein [Escherichia coli]MCJ1132910.1 DUF2570 domain-containing protein [Escherichia coli]